MSGRERIIIAVFTRGWFQLGLFAAIALFSTPLQVAVGLTMVVGALFVGRDFGDFGKRAAVGGLQYQNQNGERE